MKTSTRAAYEDACRRAVEHIGESITVSEASRLELEPLARSVGMSAFHFHRVFRGLVGETPRELERRLRLERAAALLHGDQSITDIAWESGYESLEAFSRAFRAAFHCTPSQFRAGAAEEDSGEHAPQLLAWCGLHWSRNGVDPTSLRFLNQGDHEMNARNVEVLERPELRVASVEHIGPYHQIGQAFGRLSGLAGPAGLFGPDTTMVAAYNDGPGETPEAELRSLAGMTVAAEADLPQGLSELRLPAGRWARTTHEGPYDSLSESWAWLMGQWLPDSGESLRDDASYELFLNTPMDTAPEDLRTELYIPLE